MRFTDRVLVLVASAFIVGAASSASAGWRFEENGPHPIVKGLQHAFASSEMTSGGSGTAYARHCDTIKPFKCHPERTDSAGTVSTTR